MFNFCHYSKCLRKSIYREKRFILVHRLRSFSPGRTDSIPLGLWWIMWWSWTVYLREAKWARGRGSIRNNARGRTSAIKSPSSSLLSFKYITASQRLLSWNQALNTRAVREHQDAIFTVVQTTRVERAGPCQLDTVSYRPRLWVCLGSPWVSKPELYYL